MAWEPPWKSLVEDLKDQGFESPYLDRLHERVHAYLDRQSLEREILEEMAYALGRAEDKVNLALLELDVLAAELDAAHAPPPERVRAFNDKRAEAQAALRDLLIHREALGFRRHGLVHDLYPIPRPR